MINVSRIRKVLDTIWWTDRLKNRGVLSAVLIAPADAGKTQIILEKLPETARVLNDFTYASLLDVVERDRPRWVVVPDFNMVIAHRPTVATLTSACLLGLLAEGIGEIPGLDGAAKVRIDRLKSQDITTGLVTGVTPDMFRSKRGKWRSTGLLRRILPVYYCYGATTITSISTSIKSGNDKINYTREIVKHSRELIDVSISQELGAKIDSLANEVAVRQLKWTYFDKLQEREIAVRAVEYPFSLHKMFRMYAMAHARSHNSTVVSERDYNALVDMSKFVRYDRPEEL